MKDYKRVTIRHEDGSYSFMYDYNATTPPIKTLLDRLAELEDKIEDGTLIELPRNKIKIRDFRNAVENLLFFVFVHLTTASYIIPSRK